MTEPAEPFETVELGFAQVDAQPEAEAMVTSMEATARWPAVRLLRRWERDRLALAPGGRLLDVGCGIGDVAVALARDVVPGGDVVAIDASTVMLDSARQRAAAANGSTPVRFRVGDAFDLGEPDSSFTAVRSERVLQWLDRPDRAVAEMVRVLAPGGRICLIDTDWRTLAHDVPVEDRPAAEAVTAALLRMRGEGALAGGRLLNLCRDAGLVELDCTGAVHIWTEWDPDEDEAPPGMYPLHEIVRRLTDGGLLDPQVGEQFVTAMVDAARSGHFSASLSLLAVSVRKP